MVKKLKTKWLIDHIYVDCVSEKKETSLMKIHNEISLQKIWTLQI